MEAIAWRYCADTPATQHRQPNKSPAHPAEAPTCYKRHNYPPGGRGGQRSGVFERTSGGYGRLAHVELMGGRTCIGARYRMTTLSHQLRLTTGGHIESPRGYGWAARPRLDLCAPLQRCEQLADAGAWR